MPIVYKLHSGVVYTTVTGNINDMDIKRHIVSLRDDDTVPDALIELINFQRSGDVQLDADSAKDIAALATSLHAKHTSIDVIVVAPAPSQFGIARMLRGFVTFDMPDANFNVVKTKAQGLELLAKAETGGQAAHEHKLHFQSLVQT